MKALAGAGLDQRTVQLLDEIRALRARVAELEDALEAAAEVEEAADRAERSDDTEVAVT